MRLADQVLACAVLAIPASASALAEPRHAFAIPPGTLRDAVIAVARQANVSIGVNDPALGNLRTPGVTGDMTVSSALDRLLAKTSARAERIGPESWRIVARPRARATSRPAAPATPVLPAPTTAASDIVVTGSKRGINLADYPGSAYVIDTIQISPGESGRGSETIVARVPTIASTHLGAGRNKLFIRGVADSSFNGPTQATVGQYLGDVRLNYNAPDPDLSLYDVRAIEILEGPQGTLYGAGALGGVLRIVPQPVKLADVEANLSIGHALAEHGADGGDMSGMVNLPVVSDVLAVRAVAFRTIEGGYIDDEKRGLQDVNRTHKAGGRVQLRVLPGDDWAVDLGLVLQNINTADGQYAERGLPARTRRSTIAQPFDNDYGLASLVITKDWGELHFLSATGLVRHDASSTFDFTEPGGVPTLFEQDNNIHLITSENRLSRRSSDGVGWVIGGNFAHDVEKLTRMLGPVENPMSILGVRNSVTQAAVYAEGGIRLLPNLVASVGGRLDYARLVGEALDEAEGSGAEPNRTEVTFLPSLSLAWRRGAGWMVFLRYQEGFRPGGLSITDGGTPSVQEFRGDSLSVVEAGVRFGDPSRGRFDAGATVSHARWENIQADLIDAAGLPFTANIGSGRVLGFEGHIGWRPFPDLRIEGAIFVNDSALNDPAPEFATADVSELPNIAHVGGRVGLDYQRSLTGRWLLRAWATLRYVGGSELGVQPPLDLDQGRYWDSAAGLRIDNGRFGLSIDATNIFGEVGNRFALGNPHDVAAGRQTVPLRPRTIRIGLDASF